MFSFPMLNNFAYASNIPSKVKTLTKTPVYSEASILSDFVKDNNDSDVYLEENVVLNVYTNFADTKFYKVSLYQVVDGKGQDDFGYVLISQTLDTSIMSPTAKLDTNAKIKNDDAVLYDLQNETYTPNGKTLKKDTKVRILDGYDKNKEFTYISYQTDNGDIFYSYIKTIDLYVEGINYSVIVAVSTLVACISVLLIVFGFKGKKKKKRA